MSDRTEQLRDRHAGPTLQFLVDRYHVPVLAAIMAFMIWTRTQAYGRFVRGDGSVALSAVDSWYHWRTTMYTVRNWPYTMPFDPWTGYATGRYVGQFGTLFDQLIATAALLVGLGDPSVGTVFRVAILAAPVTAALVAVPTYFIGRRLGGRIGGLAAAALLALFPGTFFYRSTVGMLQHHVAEVLFMTVAVLATMVALSVAEREKPVYELVALREFEALRRPAGYAALAGVAMALYVWTWPPGVVLVGIFGVFYAIELCGAYLRGESPDHVAFVGAVSLAVAGVLALATVEVWEASPTSFGYLQPLLALAVAAGCAFMAWLARAWDARDLERRWYPGAVAGLTLLAAIVVAVVLPDLFETLASNVQRRLFFGQHATDLTIAEAQPPDDLSRHLFREYGFAFLIALFGAIALLGRPLATDVEYRAEYLLVVVWAAFITSMAFTQVRFNYYLAVVVAVLCAPIVGLTVEWADFDRVPAVRDLQGYQVMVVLTVALILLLPLLPPVAGVTVVDAGQSAGPSGDAIKWEGSNEWLAGSSPAPGAWGGADNEDELDYYGTYAIPDDRDFEYPEGSYGVMSWWDYGHLITVQAERIPHANPFQQNARSASAFLISESEERSHLILDALVTGEPVHDRSDAELRELADRGDGRDGEGIRYVMIDDDMAGGKFSAIATWTGPGYGAFVSPQEYQVGENETITVSGVDDRYENTTLARLYFGDADGMERYRLVHESERSTQFESVAIKQGDQPWRPIYVNRELSLQDRFRIAQLERHPEVEVRTYERREAASVKTYERVEGATIAGTVDAPEGTTVTAQVVMRATTSDRTFVYSQEATVDENGEFELTVPYATDNELGPEEGYTDAAVIAEGDFVVYTGTEEDPERIGETEVSETDVYEGGAVDVTLEPAGEDETVETPEDENGDGDGDAGG